MRYWYIVYMEQLAYDRLKYRAYGIRCLCEDADGVQEKARVGDVSCDWWAVWELAYLCTRHQLRPAQLMDVAADWVADVTTVV
ncbi:DUF6514 family protein [Agathobaculum sp.]|uniref:DUF6514 family protein n=1 Tax=Agathobaculum sp. TaxID=2048138 RepID=UPI002A7F51D6|nr:DUF6514 family protein [Agathobaculum sp.]MDY3618190.1 DUF6514 family protein [Agathobaculum sp.]